MTACPLAVWDPLGPQTAYPMSRHDLVVLHTMAGPFDVVDRMFHDGGYSGTESHFGVRGDGFAKQWQDLDFRADANNEGNPRVISIETADMGEQFPPWGGSDVPAWTDAQIDTVVELVAWCCDRYGIPKQLVPDSKPGRRGIAYHRQGIPGDFTGPYKGWVPGGELWTVLPQGRGKPCPGDRRIRQLIEIVIPRVNGDDDMAWTQDDWDRMSRLVDARIMEAEDRIAARVLREFNEQAFAKDGSPFRVESLRLNRRGVNEALDAAPGDDARGLLADRLASFEDGVDTELAAIKALVTPAEPTAG